MLNCKGFGRKRSWPNLRHYPGILVEGLREIIKNLSEDSRSQDRELNLRPPEYEAGVFTNQPRRSVRHSRKTAFTKNKLLKQILSDSRKSPNSLMY
jgi:hypothetical protein